MNFEEVLLIMALSNIAGIAIAFLAVWLIMHLFAKSTSK
jgi:hypothetical protein